MHRLLRLVLLTDAVILTVLGIGLLAAPARMLEVFGYTDVPRSVEFVVGMWGAALLSVAIAHFIIYRRPAEALTDWSQLGFWRNLLEFGVTLAYVLNGTVNLRQSWPGLFIPVWFALFYLLLPILLRRGVAEESTNQSVVPHVG
jgi:hypothetical protein